MLPRTGPRRSGYSRLYGRQISIWILVQETLRGRDCFAVATAAKKQMSGDLQYIWIVRADRCSLGEEFGRALVLARPSIPKFATRSNRQRVQSSQ